MIATGALAACGRTTSLAPASAIPPYLEQPRSRIDEILSDPVFKGLDKEKLVKRFDPSRQIEANYRAYFLHTGQQPQIGKVIRRIPRSGIVIQSPGRYTFAGDIRWNPYDLPSAAIIIQSSNVTLDMAGFTLSAFVPDKELPIAGVLVAPPITTPAIRNVAVVNGTIASVTEYGIAATNVIGLKIARVSVTGLSMQNLQIRNLTPAGIYVNKSIQVTISRCSISQSKVRTDASAGIQLTNTYSATVSGCRVSGLVNDDGAVQGFSCIQCANVTTTGCTADSLQSHFNGNVLTSGHTVLGFIPILCQNLNYVDCSASRLTGCCDDCHGISVFLDGQVMVTRFRADRVLDGVSPSHSGAKATGIEVYGTNVTVTDSVASNIKAINPQDKQATGFSAWGKAIEFTRCTASNVTATGAGSRGEGFGWAPDPRWEFAYLGAYDVTYLDCIAQNCEVGFDTWYHVDSTWMHPRHKNCKTGILVQPKGKRTLSCDPCSECVIPITANLTNIARGNTIVR